MKEKLATIIEPIKDAKGCGVSIFRESGEYVWMYFGWGHKLPEGKDLQIFPLGNIDFNEIKEAATEVAKELGFTMYEQNPDDGAPAIKLYLDE